MKENKAEQLNLFEIKGKEINPIVSTLEELIEGRKSHALSTFDSIISAFDTFRIYPSSHKKSDIAKTPAEGLASDWNNVFTDLSIAFGNETCRVDID